jgi:hypothetical protein
MARGFDSKSVTDQQEDVEQARERRAAKDAATSPQRRKLELARTDLLRRMDSAPESWRAELRATLDALDDLIQKA